MSDLAAFPDTEEGVKVWLRTLGHNAFHGIPSEPPDEFVTVARIGGSLVGAPLDRARISLQVWGTTKKDASDAARSIARAVDAIEQQQLSPEVYGYGGTVDSILWQPAADTGRPRYIVDTTITARATALVVP